MALKGKNTDGQGINKLVDEKENYFTLSQRQLLIGRLADLQYKAQRKALTDDQISEILRLLSHI